MKLTDLKGAKRLRSGISQASGEMAEFLTTVVTMPFVTKQYVRDGSPVVDCFDPTTGEIFTGVPVVSLSAGGDNGFRAGASDIVMSDINNLRKSAQAYLVRNGRRKDPICIGFVFKETKRARKKKRVRREAPAGTAAPASGLDKQCPVINDVDVSTNERQGLFNGDSYIMGGQAKLLVTNQGDIVLDNKDSNQAEGQKHIHIQLAETGSLRISRVPDGGENADSEANERILLGKATRKFIDGRDPYTGTYEKSTLGAYIASLESRIKALENALINFIPAPQDGGAALKTLYGTEATSAQSAYSALWGSSYPSQPRSSSVIEAASVRISEQGLAEGECD